MKCVMGHYEQDGGLVYVPIGFKPDYVRAIDFHTDTNIKIYEWFYLMELDQASGKQEGFSIAEGVTANLADAGGITVYDSASQGPTVTTWAASSMPTARTVTAHGTYVRPTVGNAYAEREAIFECVTAGTGDTTEPVWPTYDGAQVLDGTNLWERVNDVAKENIGYQGFCIAAALQTDGQEMYFMAMQADEVIDFGDVVGWSGGVKGA